MTKLMKGQDFYTEFELYLQGLILKYNLGKDMSATDALNTALLAAKKAAGLEVDELAYKIPKTPIVQR
jgi:hypothetical protein